LIIGGNPESHREYCGTLTALERRICRFCMPYERDLTIYECRDPKMSIEEAWPRVKHFN
jgi:hypothetical protein